MSSKRRAFNGAPGSRIKHLKKPDGEPLWRSDIQYDFLHAVFHNKMPVFTNFYTKEPNKTFAEIYIDAMARSSKCSKILGDRLLNGGSAALNIAMVCILVNIGRMNTTLNFFPEMKAQLRTYHAIPSLQSQSSDQLEDKQLQDAPRLKSILKGACEDTSTPQTLAQLEETPSPRTNPINLIFILASHFLEVEERFFVEPFKLSDLIMSSNYASQSRARAFLWLCWTYLESDFSNESIASNPFGDNQLKAPGLVTLDEQGISQENIDPMSEVNFGNKMLRQRLKYLETGTAQSKSRHQVSHAAFVQTELSLPVATSHRDRKIMHEFHKLLQEKRSTQKKRRHALRLSRSWDAMKDMDPIYTSDSETTARSGPPSNGLRQYGATPNNHTGDYGEFFDTMSQVFQRILAPPQPEVTSGAPAPVQPLGVESEPSE